MVLRLVGLLVVLVLAVGVGYGLASGDPMAAVDAAGEIVVDGGLATETEIKRVDADGAFDAIETVVLFESGAANVTFSPSHPANTKLAFAHAANSICQQHYRTWQLPEFSGPITVDMRSIVAANGPYPYRSFRLQLISEGNGVCVKSGSQITFTVPESWVDEA